MGVHHAARFVLLHELALPVVDRLALNANSRRAAPPRRCSSGCSVCSSSSDLLRRDDDAAHREHGVGPARGMDCYPIATSGCLNEPWSTAETEGTYTPPRPRGEAEYSI